MKKIFPLFAVIIIFAACQKSSTLVPVTDKSSTSAITTAINEPGIYPSVLIGTQRWMTKNLDVNHYRNGDRIPQVKSQVDWAALTTGAWCWYQNDSAIGAVYGRLYNWYAVNDPRGLAPTGWHIPSDAEWDTLSTYLGNHAGGKLKETGTTHWGYPNAGANNKTGFTGLPGGDRTYTGKFFELHGYGDFWSSTQTDASHALSRYLYFNNGRLGQEDWSKIYGFSVRCIKD